MKVPRGRCCSSRMEKGFPVSTSMARNIFRRSSRIGGGMRVTRRSEEHTSELQSQSNLVCRLLLEKKKKTADVSLVEREDILCLPVAVVMTTEYRQLHSQAAFGYGLRPARSDDYTTAVWCHSRLCT